jgi:O-antigen/teichoic acid export membrane protein
VTGRHSLVVTAPASSPSGGGGLGRLFGRDMIYVLVWSLQLVTSVLVSPVLAHVLGPAQFGLIATAIAVYQVLMVLAVVGMDRAISLQRAEDGDDVGARKLLTLGIMIASSVTVAVGLAGFLWSPAIGFDGYTSLAFVVVLWVAPGAVVQMVLALLMAQDRLPAFATVSIMSAVGGPVIGIVLVLVFGQDATVYAWGGVVAQMSAVFLGVLLTRPAVRGVFDRALTSRAFQVGLPILVTGLSVFVLNASDRIVLQRLLGEVEVGRYQVAYTVGYVVVLLLGSVSQAWTPRIAAVRDQAERWTLIGRSRDELYQLLMPIVLGVTLAAPLALQIVAPASFNLVPLLPVVLLVALSAFPVAASGATNRALLTERRTRPLAWAGLIAAAVNIALNLWLIPIWGILGSAAATVVAFGVQAVLQRLALPDRKNGWPSTPPRLLVMIGLSCAVAGGSVALPQTLPWNIGRLVVAFACLAWFLVRFRGSRRG